MPRLPLAAATLLTGLSIASAAQAVSITLTNTISSTDAFLTYEFTGLPTRASSGATLTLATTGFGFDGIDLGPFGTEFMDVWFGNLNLGRFECGVANDGGILIPGHIGDADCEFSFELNVARADLWPEISDGAVNVVLDMGSGVTYFPIENDEIAVTLEFMPPVPLPASVPLMLTGLGALALYRRRNWRA